MLSLYQFPISHYCEKVRWALDFKRLDYRVRNLLPGPHVSRARKMGVAATSLPILVHDRRALQNSSDILDYLDQTFPERPLMPADAQLQKEALAWEKFADEQIGIPARMVCYHVLLDHPEIIVPLFTEHGPWYGPMLMKIIFPRLRRRMRALMKLDERTARTANQRLARAIDKVSGHLQNRSFLVGDRFSRADLATAALLAPLCKAEKYGVNWPRRFPEALEQTLAPYRDPLAWVDRVYRQYR